ncbi:MAG: DinB family protein [Pirellulales bacterium]
MNAKAAIRLSIDTGNMVAMAYLGDLTDADLMRRAAPGINTINWQLGHLIAAEHQMVNQACSGAMPPLPPGFLEKYSKETAGSDDASQFCSKDELLQVAAAQRAATLAALDKLPEADLDKPTGLDYAPTVAALFSLQGSHFLMHAGQWAVVRRQLGRPPLF